MELFDGEDGLFKAAIEGCRTYGEYGLGASTLWVDANTDATIIGVETDPAWLDRTRAALTRPTAHDLRHIDVGPVAKWGKPRSYRKRRNFLSYVEGPWSGLAKPEVVLIDGRFRVACFLTSLREATPGTAIIFDDYVKRKTYHLVEEFLRPEAVNARQAVFIVPKTRDKRAIEGLRNQFLMVME
ncbi:hypothetical protein HKCCE4037_09210 [Rhodobacterales bacterium HKCCE4037]|nr:hypothetical protein [Rhodobacterales bacterium HKCCE4037]